MSDPLKGLSAHAIANTAMIKAILVSVAGREGQDIASRQAKLDQIIADAIQSVHNANFGGEGVLSQDANEVKEMVLKNIRDYFGGLKAI